jgi:hypothetical protein
VTTNHTAPSRSHSQSSHRTERLVLHDSKSSQHMALQQVGSKTRQSSV